MNWLIKSNGAIKHIVAYTWCLQKICIVKTILKWIYNNECFSLQLVLFLQVQMQGHTQQTQQPTLGNSFIDNNIGIEDLSASFRTIYKNMFETNPAGLFNLQLNISSCNKQ